MNDALTFFVALLAWRFIVCLAVAIAVGLPIGGQFGPVAGFAVVLIGLGFGLILQGRWLSGISLFAVVPSPPISKPVAFIGFAFIGAIWGGFASELTGSLFGGSLALVAAVTLVGAWLTCALKRHGQLGHLIFAAASSLVGLACIYAVTLLRG